VTVATLVPPRAATWPEYSSSAGREAVELAAEAGLFLDPWQQLVLEHSLGEGSDGRWAALEVGVNVPRQNGKGGILEARELAGLFLLGERNIMHTAQLFKTAHTAFMRLLTLIEQAPDLKARVKRVARGRGEESIMTHDGCMIEYFTRHKRSGRGLTADLVILDEAMFLPEADHGALMPTLSARPNPQVWYTGSAVDQFIHEDGVVWARVRERGLAGDDRLAYFEWSASDAASPLDLDDPADEVLWERANPALDVRIDREFVDVERRSLDRRAFAVERLGVGDWPPTAQEGASVIDLDLWDSLADRRFRSDGLTPCLAFDVVPDQSASSICAAFRGPDDVLSVEIVPTGRRPGTRWVVPELVRLVEEHEPVAVLCGAASPAEALEFQCAEQGLDVQVVKVSDHALACALLAQTVADRKLRHLGDDGLRAALKGAARKPHGEGWLWSRRHSAVDISPLVAATLALWGQAQLGADADWEPLIF
jgi:hypothetical protein